MPVTKGISCTILSTYKKCVVQNHQNGYETESELNKDYHHASLKDLAYSHQERANLIFFAGQHLNRDFNDFS